MTHKKYNVGMGSNFQFRITSGLLALAIISVLVPTARCQDAFDEYEAVGASYHKFVLPGEASVTVLVLGTGGAGLYEVGRGTDLGRLLALTGAALSPGGGEVRSKTTFRLYRGVAGRSQRQAVYEATLPEFLSSPDQYPQLQDGDVFIVETVSRPRFSWRDALSIVTATAALSLTMERLGWL